MKVCLDAGHYGQYNKSKVVSGYYESEMVWKLHNYLADKLNEYGIDVVKTRADLAKDLGLTARGKKAKGCDLFISLHSNACDVEEIDYPLVVTMQDGKGDALGTKLAKCIEDLMDTRQAGKIAKKKGTYGGEWYSVLEGARQVGVMGLIIEHSFHTNIKATKWLLVDANLKTMAKAEAEIIAEHFGVSKKTEIAEKPKTESKVMYRVQVGAYGEKANAEAMVAKLKTAGFNDAVIVTEGEESPAQPWVPAVGDIVNFTGSKQYASSTAASSKTASAGEAKITVIAEGKKHPYHLVRTGKTGPYGWVDAGTFKKA